MGDVLQYSGAAAFGAGGVGLYHVGKRLNPPNLSHRITWELMDEAAAKLSPLDRMLKGRVGRWHETEHPPPLSDNATRHLRRASAQVRIAGAASVAAAGVLLITALAD